MSDFMVGNKVVHPCYGAGTIVRIQEKSIGDDVHSYYIIKTVSRSMQLMVPVSRADFFGLRMVGDQIVLRNQLRLCCDQPGEGEIESDLRARQAGMRDQLKQGEYGGIAKIVRALFYLNSQRPLGTVDRQLFEQGKEFLAGELALAADMELPEAIDQVQDHLAQMLRGENDE